MKTLLKIMVNTNSGKSPSIAVPTRLHQVYPSSVRSPKAGGSSISKRCPKCKETKSFSEFHKNKKRGDGHSGWCKTCRNKADRVYRKGYRQTENGKQVRKKNNKIYCLKYPQKIKAKAAVNWQIHIGNMKPPSFFKCVECDKQAEHYHHPSYAKEHWFDVMPVCCSCHNKIHNFAHLLLLSRTPTLARRTSRRPASFLKGQENGNLSKYCKSDCSVDDNRCRRPEFPAGVEKPVSGRPCPVILRNVDINHKLPFWMNIVKIKIPMAGKIIRKGKPCVSITN